MLTSTTKPEATVPADVASVLDSRIKKKRVPYYYEALNKSCDALVRCHECGRLVTHGVLTVTGMTPCCGTKRVRQVQHLSTWEWIKLRLGLIDFPYRKEFLAEFRRGGHDDAA